MSVIWRRTREIGELQDFVLKLEQAAKRLHGSIGPSEQSVVSAGAV